MDRVRIQSVEALPGYTLRVGLSDGRIVERAFPDLATPIGPMDAPLQDPAYFAQVRLDPDLETAVWPNGYDICPDLLIKDEPPAWATADDAAIAAAHAEIHANVERLNTLADRSKE